MPGIYSVVEGILPAAFSTAYDENRKKLLALVSDDMVAGADDMAGLARARLSDPVTSVTAAAGATKFLKTHQDRILFSILCLQAVGTPPTAKAIARHTGLTVVQIDRRLPELQRAGKATVLQDSDGAPCVHDGFRVWRAM